MAELRREVKPVEINYLCDKCGKGMVIKLEGDATDEKNHQCVICGEGYHFNGKGYPRIVYVPAES